MEQKSSMVEGLQKSFNFIALLCWVMSTLPTLWLRIPSTVGPKHFKFPALVWFFSFPLQVEAAYCYVTKGIAPNEELDYKVAIWFWYASFGLLLIHRIATAIREKRGGRTWHSEYWGVSWFGSDEATAKGSREPAFGLMIGFLGAAIFPTLGVLILASSFFQACLWSLIARADKSEKQKVWDAMAEQEWMKRTLEEYDSNKRS